MFLYYYDAGIQKYFYQSSTPGKVKGALTWGLSVGVQILNRCSHQSSSVEKVFLKILQNSQENNCARVCFLIRFKSAKFLRTPFLQNTFELLLLPKEGIYFGGWGTWAFEVPDLTFLGCPPCVIHHFCLTFYPIVSYSISYFNNKQICSFPFFCYMELFSRKF